MGLPVCLVWRTWIPCHGRALTQQARRVIGLLEQCFEPSKAWMVDKMLDWSRNSSQAWSWHGLAEIGWTGKSRRHALMVRRRLSTRTHWAHTGALDEPRRELVEQWDRPCDHDERDYRQDRARWARWGEESNLGHACTQGTLAIKALSLASQPRDAETVGPNKPRAYSTEPTWSCHKKVEAIELHMKPQVHKS